MLLEELGLSDKVIKKLNSGDVFDTEELSIMNFNDLYTLFGLNEKEIMEVQKVMYTKLNIRVIPEDELSIWDSSVLIELMRTSGITVEMLSLYSGISEDRLTELIKGTDVIPSAKELIVLACIFDVDAKVFYKGYLKENTVFKKVNKLELYNKLYNEVSEEEKIGLKLPYPYNLLNRITDEKFIFSGYTTFEKYDKLYTFLVGEFGVRIANRMLDFIVFPLRFNEEYLIHNEDIAKFSEYLKSFLENREYHIIYLRYHDEKSLDAVDSLYNLTRERIRQIEDRALRKIKVNLANHGFKSFINNGEYQEKLEKQKQILSDLNKVKDGVQAIDKLITNAKCNIFNKTFLSLIDNTINEDNSSILEIGKSIELMTPVEELGLSIRSTNALKRAGIQIFGDILNFSYSDLGHIRNLGSKSVNEIFSLVKDAGYELKPEK